MRIQLSPSKRWTLELPEKRCAFSKRELGKVFAQAKRARAQYEATQEIASLSFFKDPVPYLLYLIASHAPEEAPFSLTLESELPFRAGLGSSAALATAAVAALWKAFGKRVARDKLFAAVQDMEVCQHGTPSGADAYASIYGGIFSFQRHLGKIEPLDLKFPFSAALLFTGTPENSTAEVVAAVKRRRDKKRWFQLMEEGRKNILKGMAEQDFLTFREGIQSSQRGLERLGVTTSSVRRQVAELEKKNLAAKQCGAGTLQGEGGGCILVVGPHRQALQEGIQGSLYPSLDVQLGVSRARWESKSR